MCVCMFECVVFLSLGFCSVSIVAGGETVILHSEPLKPTTLMLLMRSRWFFFFHCSMVWFSYQDVSWSGCSHQVTFGMDALKIWHYDTRQLQNFPLSHFVSAETPEEKKSGFFGFVLILIHQNILSKSQICSQTQSDGRGKWQFYRHCEKVEPCWCFLVVVDPKVGQEGVKEDMNTCWPFWNMASRLHLGLKSAENKREYNCVCVIHVSMDELLCEVSEWRAGTLAHIQMDSETLSSLSECWAAHYDDSYCHYLCLFHS